MRRRHPWIAACSRWLAVMILVLAPATTLARTDEIEPDIIDARLEGYADNVSLPAGSSGLTWVIFIVLSVITGAGLFKDAKRSHLD